VQFGERSRIVVLIHDVTRRKALQRQLLHVQKMEAVGRLAGGVAHDFNNLLAAMMGAAEVASMRLEAGEDARAQLEEIVDTGERGAELIRQLLAFSEERVARPERLELGEVVRGVGPMLMRLLGKGIALEVELDPAAPAVVGDRSQLERVLVNLAVNARDAMGGHGTLAISVGPAPGGAQALLVVADDGSGMTEEVREQVFEPFFTTKELGQGTGLGLATVLGIVVQAGGTISVDSAPGEGTRFEIRWPAAADDPGGAT
jgi:signal transduction histidine kinase